MLKSVVIACLGASCSFGCSLLFVTSPPATVEKLPPSEPVQCTSSKAAPVIDTLIAGYQVFRTGYALSRSNSDYKGAPIDRNADIGIGVGLAALFIASSIYGYSVTSECAEAKDNHERKGRELNAESTNPDAFTFSPNRRASHDSASDSFTVSSPRNQEATPDPKRVPNADAGPLPTTAGPGAPAPE
jgi:hypothetical protein